jgi:hypothetical protein
MRLKEKKRNGEWKGKLRGVKGEEALRKTAPGHCNLSTEVHQLFFSFSLLFS